MACTKHSTPRTAKATYSELCVEEWEAPLHETTFAALVCWLTLAGFLVLPTTFVSSSALLNSDEGRAVQAVFTGQSSIYAPIVLCVIGICGECCIWYHKQRNYVFLLRQIF